jgi:hypothetical protein
MGDRERVCVRHQGGPHRLAREPLFKVPGLRTGPLELGDAVKAPPLPGTLALEPIESFDEPIPLGFPERNENQFAAEIQGQPHEGTEHVRHLSR